MTIAGAASATAERFDEEARTYDALLLVSFGGPESPEHVLPFLQNVTRGRDIPPDRLREVADHYQHFGGVSPLNAQNRALIDALAAELAHRGHPLPIYFGNRNWDPFLADTIRTMRDDGVRRALALVTSAFSSYSGCRQYREDVLRASAEVGAGAPIFDKIRVFYDHPGFIDANAANLRATLPDDRAGVEVVFTAHSIPESMARGCAYAAQLEEAARLVAERAGVTRWSLAYQSRSGPPHVPWLGPDILERLDALAHAGARTVVVHPVGFLSDHVEVLYDLDTEARERAAHLGLGFRRVPTVGTRPEFIAGLGALVVERLTAHPVRLALGRSGPSHDTCAIDCCLSGRPGGRDRP